MIKVSQKMVADRVLMAISLKASRKKVAAGGGPPSLSRDRLNHDKFDDK